MQSVNSRTYLDKQLSSYQQDRYDLQIYMDTFAYNNLSFTSQLLMSATNLLLNLLIYNIQKRIEQL